MDVRIYLITVITFLGIIIPVISYSVLLIPPDYSSHTKESKVMDPDKLFNELENYDSYRPDSYSDAVRNPFGDKRYRNLKPTTESQN